MKALISHRAGGPETLLLQELPDPVAKAGELLLDVLACGVNYPDALMIQDLYQVKMARPFSPGSEVCAVVAALGPGVNGFSIGDHVIARCGIGGMAQKLALPAQRCVRIPAHLPVSEAAGFSLTYTTGFHALRDCADVQPSETLLVLGAAGGVGAAAIDLGRACGMRVLAAASTQAKLDFALACGASDGLVYPSKIENRDQEKALADRFKTLAGAAGVDVVFDPVGGVYSEAAFRALRPHGRHLIVGFTAGIARLPTNLPLLKRSAIVGVDVRAFSEQEPQAYARNVDTLLALWADAKLHPAVSERYPLARGGEAIARFAQRDVLGKLVVEIAPCVTRARP